MGRPDGMEDVHPASPYVLQYKEGPSRLSASLYWMQYLDYFHWSGVQHFSSLADLLGDLLSDTLLLESSGLMREFLVRQRRCTMSFWRDALRRLTVSFSGNASRATSLE